MKKTIFASIYSFLIFSCVVETNNKNIKNDPWTLSEKNSIENNYLYDEKLGNYIFLFDKDKVEGTKISYFNKCNNDYKTYNGTNKLLDIYIEHDIEYIRENTNDDDPFGGVFEVNDPNKINIKYPICNNIQQTKQNHVNMADYDYYLKFENINNDLYIGVEKKLYDFETDNFRFMWELDLGLVNEDFSDYVAIVGFKSKGELWSIRKKTCENIDKETTLRLFDLFKDMKIIYKSNGKYFSPSFSIFRNKLEEVLYKPDISDTTKTSWYKILHLKTNIFSICI
jgi:hypothetical protein